jgi:hypothetical protein
MSVSSEWKDEGMSGDYYVEVHKPCGTRVYVMAGYTSVCPKCQPEEHAKQEARERLYRA